jgi:hypothetical protein
MCAELVLDIAQKSVHSEPQCGLGVASLTAALNVDRDAQGLAPNSPIRQRSPRR